MTVTRITKFLKKGKRNEALAALIESIRGDYENKDYLEAIEQVAQSMTKSRGLSQTQLLCGFVDELIKQKRFGEAVPLASYIYRFLNHLPEPTRLMVILCEKLQDPNKAQTYCERLCKVQPENANNFAFLGRLKRTNRDLQGALDCFNHALRLDDKNEGLLSELGIFLFDVHQYENSAEIYSKLYDLYPNNDMAAANLIICLMAIGKTDEALCIIEKGDTHLLRNGFYLDAKAKIYLEIGNMEKALECAERAVSLMPGKDTFKATLSHVLLSAGRLREGFEQYKHRFSKDMVGGVLMDDISLPVLERKSDIAGKHIFVSTEQGFGDTLNFCRLTKLITDEGGKVTFGVQAPLLNIMQHAFPELDVVLGKDYPADADYFCPLLNIASIFRIGLEDLPLMQDYIDVDPEFLSKWKDILGEKKQLRVGLTWSGGTATRHDRKRTIPLEHFLNALPEGPDYISLQKEVRDTDVDTLNAHPEIRHFGPQLEDFKDTAALVELVDIVLCVDTSIVHLTGAMGKQAWLLLPFKADFRWLTEREDSPWYPSVTLLRQAEPGEWDPVLQRAHDGLSELMEQFTLKTAS